MLPDARPNDDRIRNFDFELDQMLIELVMRDHPEWKDSPDSWFQAWLEAQRLRVDAEDVELLSN